jgi:hypothetical protein
LLVVVEVEAVVLVVVAQEAIAQVHHLWSLVRTQSRLVRVVQVIPLLPQTE